MHEYTAIAVDKKILSLFFEKETVQCIFTIDLKM